MRYMNRNRRYNIVGHTTDGRLIGWWGEWNEWMDVPPSEHIKEVLDQGIDLVTLVWENEIEVQWKRVDDE